MTSFLAFIGICTVLYLTYRFTSSWLALRNADKVFINGKRESINKLYTVVATEIGFTKSDMLLLSPYITVASKDLAHSIHTEDMPYQALIAYFIAGSAQGSAAENAQYGQENKSAHYKKLAEQAIEYADSFAPPFP